MRVSDLSYSASFVCWAVIVGTYLRFKKGVEVQGMDRTQFQWAFTGENGSRQLMTIRQLLQPMAAISCLLGSVLVFHRHHLQRVGGVHQGQLEWVELCCQLHQHCSLPCTCYRLSGGLSRFRIELPDIYVALGKPRLIGLCLRSGNVQNGSVRRTWTLSVTFPVMKKSATKSHRRRISLSRSATSC